MHKLFLQDFAYVIVSEKKLFVKYKTKFFLRGVFVMLQKKAKGFKRKGIKCQRRFVGVFYNRFKKKLNLDIIEAVYLSCLKKMYEKNKKNGLITLRGYFATTLYDMARMSKIPLYYQKQVINKLKMRGIIKYDPLLFDEYDEGSDPMVLFKILC